MVRRGQQPADTQRCSVLASNIVAGWTIQARQVITSTTYDQEALDNILIEDREYKLGNRGKAIADHSPFAYALLQV